MTDSARYHHGNLRPALLARAVEVIEVDGVRDMSLRRIARDLGVSHGAPQRHFSGKADLLDAVAKQGFTMLGEAYAETMRNVGGGDRLTALAVTYLEFSMARPELVQLMFTRKHSPVEGMDEAVAEAFRVPLEVIAEEQRRGNLIEGDPEQLGIYVVAVLHGLTSLAGAGFITAESSQSLLASAAEHLLQGLRPR